MNGYEVAPAAVRRWRQREIEAGRLPAQLTPDQAERIATVLVRAEREATAGSRTKKVPA